MAEFPAVKSVGQLLSEMSNRDAQTKEMTMRTQLLGAEVKSQEALTQQRMMQDLLMQRQIENEDKAADQIAKSGLDSYYNNKVAQQQQYDNPVTALKSSLQDYTAHQQNLFQRAQIMRENKLPKEADQLMKEAFDIGKTKTATQMTLLKQQQDDAKEIGSIASAVTDEDSFQLALPQLKARDANFGKQAAFDHDPLNGEVAWGPKTAKAMKSLGDMARTSEQKYNDQIKDYNAIVNKQKADAATQSAETRAAAATVQASVAEARIALLQAQKDLAGARTGKAEAETTKITSGDVKKAQAKAARAPIKNEVVAAENEITSTVDFADDDLKTFPDLPKFASDVAAVANKIVADDAAKGIRTGYDDALGQAIAKLKPYVKDSTTGAIFKSKVKRYVRPATGNVSGGDIRQGGPETAVQSGTTGPAKPTVDSVAGKWGG